MRLPFLPKKTEGSRRSGVRRTNMAANNYYRSGSKTASPRSPFEKKVEKPEKARKFLVRSLDLAVLLIVIGALIYSLLVSSNPKVAASSETYNSTQTYKRAASQDLSELKNRNKITLNEQSIVRDLQTKFPEVSGASVELPLFAATPVIHLQISPPVFILQNPSGRYVIDGQGRAVTEAADLASTNKLPVVVDQSGFKVAAGQQVLSAGAVSFISSVLAQLNRAQVPVQSLTLPPAAEELDLRTTDHPYYTKFFLGGDALTQAGQFLASRHQFDSTNSQPSQYLDVRVPGKIFYK